MTINRQDYGVGELQITSLPFDRGLTKLNLEVQVISIQCISCSMLTYSSFIQIHKDYDNLSLTLKIILSRGEIAIYEMCCIQSFFSPFTLFYKRQDDQLNDLILNNLPFLLQIMNP